MVDMLDLGSSEYSRVGSSPPNCIIKDELVLPFLSMVEESVCTFFVERAYTLSGKDPAKSSCMRFRKTLYDAFFDANRLPLWGRKAFTSHKVLIKELDNRKPIPLLFLHPLLHYIFFAECKLLLAPVSI